MEEQHSHTIHLVIHLETTTLLVEEDIVVLGALECQECQECTVEAITDMVVLAMDTIQWGEVMQKTGDFQLIRSTIHNPLTFVLIFHSFITIVYHYKIDLFK